MAKYISKIKTWSQLSVLNYSFLSLCICPRRYRYQTNVDVSSKFISAINENGEKYRYNQESYTRKQKKVIILTLQEILNLNSITAIEIAERWKDVYQLHIPEIIENVKYLKSYGISEEIMIQYPFLLGVNDINKKIEMIKQLPYKVSETAPLMHYTNGKLAAFVDKELELINSSRGGRIDFLCSKLECTPDYACHTLIRYPFLTKYSYTRLENNLQILFKYGITLEAVKKDCWVLAYTPNLIETRLEKAKESQVVELKTWMVRCQSNIMNKCIERKQSTKSILGSNSPAQYLSERLECTLEEAKMIIARNKPLQTKSTVKLKEILDWLYSEGFQPYQVQRVPRVLLHSAETIKSRVKSLRDLEYNIDSLVYLLKSKKDFQKFLENVKLKKKKNTL